MTPASPNALDWEGQTVLDRAGEKIGTIEEIFLVEETGRPEWALVKIGRLKGHTTLVPLTRAHPVHKGIKVAFEKDKISDAPAVKGDADPDEQQVNALYRHYGLPIPTSGTSNGASAATVSQPPPAAQPPSQPASQSKFRTSSGSSAAPSGSSQGSYAPSQGSSQGSFGDLRDAPIGDVVNEVKDQASTLVSQEMRLAKAEMAGKAKEVGVGAGIAGGAGYVAYLASIAFMFCLIFALSEFMAQWLAALIVTVVFGAVAGVLALQAKKKLKKAGPPIPQQTVESVKQTIETVKEEAKWGLGQTR